MMTSETQIGLANSTPNARNSSDDVISDDTNTTDDVASADDIPTYNMISADTRVSADDIVSTIARLKNRRGSRYTDITRGLELTELSHLIYNI